MPETRPRTDRLQTGDALAVEVMREGGDWRTCEPCEELIEAAAEALAAKLRPGRCAAALALCDDARIREMNKAYRDQDKPTNVLSFPAAVRGRPGRGPREIGDIAIAAEMLVREAAEQCIDPRHHLQHLVIHGLLHLLGYDHETDAEAEAMEALEIDVLASLGIANPYAPPPDLVTDCQGAS